MEGYEKLGYMALNVSDVGRSRDFYEKQVGLQLSGEAEGSAFLRCSEDHHSISLHGGGQPGLKRAGCEMRSAAALDQLGANLAAEGITVVSAGGGTQAAWTRPRLPHHRAAHRRNLRILRSYAPMGWPAVQADGR
jgi:2,3-dihydroxy-p-cumate/2,3-dihydroxybenzoate 3,4-dioxygenase